MRLVSSEKYRRDIDGLRAIAVIAVIFFAALAFKIIPPVDVSTCHS